MYSVTAANEVFFSGKMEKNIFKTFHDSMTKDEFHMNKRESQLTHQHDPEKTNKKRKKHKVKDQKREGNNTRKGEEVMHTLEHKAKCKKRERKPKESRPDSEINHASSSLTETSEGIKPMKIHGLPRQITGQNRFQFNFFSEFRLNILK